MIRSLTVNLSHMGAFTLSVPLLLHLGLHLGNHLLHSPQLWRERNPHVYQIQHCDTQKPLMASRSSESESYLSLLLLQDHIFVHFLRLWSLPVPLKENQLSSCTEP